MKAIIIFQVNVKFLFYVSIIFMAFAIRNTKMALVLCIFNESNDLALALALALAFTVRVCE